MVILHGNYMKPEEYNPIAIFKSTFSGTQETISLLEVLDSLSSTTIITIIGLLIATFLAGYFLRKEGESHIA